MIKCKNHKTEISRLWLPEILLRLFVGVHQGHIKFKVNYSQTWSKHHFSQSNLISSLIYILLLKFRNILLDSQILTYINIGAPDSIHWLLIIIPIHMAIWGYTQFLDIPIYHMFFKHV